MMHRIMQSEAGKDTNDKRFEAARLYTTVLEKRNIKTSISIVLVFAILFYVKKFHGEDCL